jgi:hypothetical protein
MTRFPIALILASSSLSGLTGCGSSGPVDVEAVEAPTSPIDIDPRLASRIKIPAKPDPVQGFKTTPEGLLQYYFELENVTEERHSVRITATFSDEDGFPVDRQSGTVEFLQPYQIKSFSVISANSKAKKVMVQVLPAY